MPRTAQACCALVDSPSCTCTLSTWIVDKVHVRLFYDFIDLPQVGVFFFKLANALLLSAWCTAAARARGFDTWLRYAHPSIKRGVPYPKLSRYGFKWLVRACQCLGYGFFFKLFAVFFSHLLLSFRLDYLKRSSFVHFFV